MTAGEDLGKGEEGRCDVPAHAFPRRFGIAVEDRLSNLGMFGVRTRLPESLNRKLRSPPRQRAQVQFVQYTRHNCVVPADANRTVKPGIYIAIADTVPSVSLPFGQNVGELLAFGGGHANRGQRRYVAFDFAHRLEKLGYVTGLDMSYLDSATRFALNQSRLLELHQRFLHRRPGHPVVFREIWDVQTFARTKHTRHDPLHESSKHRVDRAAAGSLTGHVLTCL